MLLAGAGVDDVVDDTDVVVPDVVEDTVDEPPPPHFGNENPPQAPTTIKNATTSTITIIAIVNLTLRHQNAYLRLVAPS